jgi:magnesium-protoporphyrin O-methyltransferase
MGAEVGPADVVFGNRVICCYPDMPAMVDAMTSRAQERLAASYPRDRWMTRLGVRFLNLLLRLRRVGFQAYVHSPKEIKDRVEHAGFELTASGKTSIWLWQVWERSAA